jgi:filamentous hemagglutinin
MGAGGGSGSNAGIRFPKNPSQVKHIFAEREGHVPDTFENRKLILDTVSNPANYRGKDKWGIDNYSHQLSDGRQVWARVRVNTIDDAGINTIERLWDGETGFKRNPKG